MHNINKKQTNKVTHVKHKQHKQTQQQRHKQVTNQNHTLQQTNNAKLFFKHQKTRTYCILQTKKANNTGKQVKQKKQTNRQQHNNINK